jgi:phosphopantothenoylcysteine decarboxylase/phosphopantothenate--cysteine ligase
MGDYCLGLLCGKQTRAKMSAGKRILLIIGGGIAAYKSLDLIRRLKERGIATRAILTQAGAQFVTPLSLAALTGDRVYQSLFDLTDESEMGHIQLSRDADLIVVAPATADLIARMAGGLANDLATTALLATDKPVLIAPAMNVRMWDHAATRRNVARVAADGVHLVGPNEGDMACGEFGPGRMAEPLEIVAAIEGLLAPKARPLAGKRIIVTAGPTHEPIDPVRYIANRSSGRQGYALASALAQLGADVRLISGPVTLPTPAGIQITRVETAREMKAAVDAALPADAAVFTAAVADWRMANAADEKIKKTADGPPSLALIENPDILRAISSPGPLRPKLVVGFAAETQNIEANAIAKRRAKGCDWIVANDVSPATGIMGGEENAVHVITDSGMESWARQSKTEVAKMLAARIAEALAT